MRKNVKLLLVVIPVIMTLLVCVLLNYKSKRFFEIQTQQFLADVVTTNSSSATTNQLAEYFKLFSYPSNGSYAVANADKTIVSLKDKNDQIVWSAKVVEFIKSMPNEGGLKVLSLSFITNDVWGKNVVTDQFIVMVGRSCVGLDRLTGKIIYYGSN